MYCLPTINRLLAIAPLGCRLSMRLVPIGIATLFSAQAAGALELKVLSGGAMRSPLQELAREFEAASGHRLVIESGMDGTVEEKVVAGDPVDVVIISKPVFDKLVGVGKLVGGTGAPLAHVPIGLAVKAGAPKPEIRTVAAWQQALLTANIITYGDPA